MSTLTREAPQHFPETVRHYGSHSRARFVLSRHSQDKASNRKREREKKRENKVTLTLPMKLIGDGAGGRKVLVGVKLDPRSRELLTWALVKVAEPGDLVIALHVLDTITEGTSSLLSLVKTFDSVLAVYEGFCNLKQVGLRLKVCRGGSVRKVLVQEAKSFGVSTVILGTSKSHHTIRSSAWVAKYCAKKLPKCISVFSVDNGKIAFRREATGLCSDREKSHEGSTLSPKALVVYTNKNMKSCGSCALQGSSGTEFEQGLCDDVEKENSLALVPFRKLDDDAPCFSVVVDNPKHKPGWSLLRNVFQHKKHSHKSSMKNTFVFQRALRQPNFHSSAVVHPDHKQISIEQIDDSPLDGVSGAIVPFGSATTITPPSLCSDLSSLPDELLVLQEKYSSSCRLYSLKELEYATSNFAPENLVGRGGSSYVYRGCLPDGKELAVKILKPSENVLKEFVQEIEIITTLRHKNIISISGFCLEGNHLLLVYDFLSRGSLEENLHGNKTDCSAFGWQERYKVAVGVAEALDYLHNGCAQAVIHRDVKSSNVLLSDDFQPQILDWLVGVHLLPILLVLMWLELLGEQRPLVPSLACVPLLLICSEQVLSGRYLAPEYFMHGRVTDKIDVYAFGVVLLELLSNRKPINNECPKGQESLVMWATPILEGGKFSQLLDPSLGSEFDDCQIKRMVLAATLCIRRVPRFRPQISLILKLLHGDEEVTRWAEQEVNAPQELDGFDEEPVPTNIQSHLNLALLDLEDDTVSISSTEQSVSLEDYLQGRWSRSSIHFDTILESNVRFSNSAVARIGSWKRGPKAKSVRTHVGERLGFLEQILTRANYSGAHIRLGHILRGILGLTILKSFDYSLLEAHLAAIEKREK
ncbi:Receptor-like cytosolic serine/threonine-protein kinase RBK2, partial [Mucuna pruriens]